MITRVVLLFALFAALLPFSALAQLQVYEFNGTTAVSYTHLDVYKRQGYGYGGYRGGYGYGYGRGFGYGYGFGLGFGLGYPWYGGYYGYPYYPYAYGAPYYDPYYSCLLYTSIHQRCPGPPENRPSGPRHHQSRQHEFDPRPVHAEQHQREQRRRRRNAEPEAAQHVFVLRINFCLLYTSRCV